MERRLRYFEITCRSAKQARHRANEAEEEETGCWLDWHVGSVRPGEPLKMHAAVKADPAQLRANAERIRRVLSAIA